MTFRVGMKVVCIECRRGTCCGRMEPDIGDIATISGIYWHSRDNCLVLELQEFPAPNCTHAGPGWCSESFRPLIERKSEISFTEGAPLESERFDNRKKQKERA